MDNFIKKIKKYFEAIESHETQVEEWLKECARPLNSILNQSTIFRAVAAKDSICHSPFKQFEEFRESLYEAVLSSLEEELELLERVRDKINVANESLHKEQKCIENLYHELRQKKLMNVSDLNPSCPRLEHILDWCYDIWNYYHTFYLQISQALASVDFESEESVELLSKSFKEDLEVKKYINKIRSFDFPKFDFLI